MGFKRNRNMSNSEINYSWENLQQYKNKLLKFCLSEKWYIIDFIDDNCLSNKRNEFISGCKH